MLETLQVLGVEGQLSGDEHVEYDAHAPHVHLGAVVLLAGEDLGRSVWRRAAERLQRRLHVVVAGEAEVGQLDVHVGVEEQVLALEVAMHHVLVVAVLDGR